MTQSVPVRIPKLSMAAVSGTFLEWLVDDGEQVAAQQPIYLATTDKIEIEVESPAAGILRHGTAEAEEEYSVGTEIGTIETSEG